MDLRYFGNSIRCIFVRNRYSFSKDGEDLWISRFFPETDGTYIDIGAGHPLKNNNTFLFYKKGWTGICVEPVSMFSILYRIVRPRDTYIKGVCSKLTEVVFFEYNPKEYSTVNEARHVELSKHGFAPRKVRVVKGYSVKNIVDKLDLNLPCFLSIDAEGSEVSILEQLLTMSFRPRVICAEQFKNQHGVQGLLHDLGYENLTSCGKNLIFVHRDFKV